MSNYETKPCKLEWALAGMFLLVVTLLIVGCVPDNPPDSCPLPAYKVGDIVLVDDAYVGTVIERVVLGCGDIQYVVGTEVGGHTMILRDVKEDRILPLP